MPLHIDRAAIAAARQHERANHEVSLDRAAARRPADAAPKGEGTAATGTPDVNVDVRGMAAGHPDLEHVERAEQVARQVRGASIEALKSAHGEVDPQRAAALLA